MEFGLLPAVPFGGVIGPALAGVQLGQALECPRSGRVDLGEGLEFPSLDAEITGRTGEPGSQARTSASVNRPRGGEPGLGGPQSGLGPTSRAQMSQARQTAGSSGRAARHLRSRASAASARRPGPPVEVRVRQAQPDSVVVGGVTGCPFKHEAGALHGHRLEVEEPEAAEHAHQVGCEAQLLSQELPRLIAAILMPQGPPQYLAGLRRLRPAVGDRPPK